MSISVYFDFHSPELYQADIENNWSKWYARLVQLELAGKETYFPERVSDLSNLITPNNLLAWEIFQEEYSGKIVDRSLIASIIVAWNKLYHECQGSTDCQPKDIFTSGQLKILLKKYKGNHLVFRTN